MVVINGYGYLSVAEQWGRGVKGRVMAWELASYLALLSVSVVFTVEPRHVSE